MYLSHMISLVEPLNLEHKGLKRLVLISQLLGKLLDGSDEDRFVVQFKLRGRGHACRVHNEPVDSDHGDA